MTYLILIGLGAAAVYRFWPDICAHIVETGLKKPAPVEPTAAEKFHAVASAVAAKPDPDPTLASAVAAALKAKP